MTASESRQVGYLEATAIGIGGMVGGGIFAVLGLSVDLAHGGAPVAFLIAGAVALVTAYSYARLSVALLWQTALTSPGQIWILVAMITLAFTTELTFRLTSGRKLHVFKAARFN